MRTDHRNFCAVSFLFRAMGRYPDLDDMNVKVAIGTYDAATVLA